MLRNSVGLNDKVHSALVRVQFMFNSILYYDILCKYYDYL